MTMTAHLNSTAGEAEVGGPQVHIRPGYTVRTGLKDQRKEDGVEGEGRGDKAATSTTALLPFTVEIQHKRRPFHSGTNTQKVYNHPGRRGHTAACPRG